MHRSLALRIGALLVVLAVATVAAGCGLVPSADEQSTTDSGVVAVGPPRTGAPELGSAEGYDAAGEAAPTDAKGALATDGERLVITTKTLRVEVESTPDAVDEIRTLAKQHKAVITDLQVASDTDEWLYRYDEYGYVVGDGAALRGWVTVRVPADGYEAFIEAAAGLGTVKYQAENSQDVTQEHVDLSARLANLQAEEKRLREFFDAAKNVDDMLAIERELSRVRGEIESLDAQVKYLERQAAMATVTIELTEQKPVVRPEGESWGFSEAVTAGFRGAANVITFVLALVIATSPLWIVALVAFLVVRAILRRRRMKRQDAASDQTSENSTPGA